MHFFRIRQGHFQFLSFFWKSPVSKLLSVLRLFFIYGQIFNNFWNFGHFFVIFFVFFWKLSLKFSPKTRPNWRFMLFGTDFFTLFLIFWLFSDTIFRKCALFVWPEIVFFWHFHWKHEVIDVFSVFSLFVTFYRYFTSRIGLIRGKVENPLFSAVLGLFFRYFFNEFVQSTHFWVTGHDFQGSYLCSNHHVFSGFLCFFDKIGGFVLVFFRCSKYFRLISGRIFRFFRFAFVLVFREIVKRPFFDAFYIGSGAFWSDFSRSRWHFCTFFEKYRYFMLNYCVFSGFLKKSIKKERLFTKFTLENDERRPENLRAEAVFLKISGK